MVKKFMVLLTLTVFLTAGIALAADKAQKTVPATAVQMPEKAARPTQAMRSDFGIIAGTLASIDNSDPLNVRLTVKNEKDGSTHTLTVMPWTNITRSAEISELKAGEKIRVMSRKTDNKEVAMGIMFGNIKMPQPPKPPVAPAATKSQVTGTTKK